MSQESRVKRKKTEWLCTHHVQLRSLQIVHKRAQTTTGANLTGAISVIRQDSVSHAAANVAV